MDDNDIKTAFQGRLLSIVIPAFNEEKRIGATLSRVIEYVRAMEWDFEIIVVDDGSADETADAARRGAGDTEIKIIRNESNRGKGYSVRRGILEAKGDARLFTDADLSTPIEEIEKLIPCWLDGAGVVFGSRSVKGARLEVRQNPLREYMGKTFNLFVRSLALPGYKDTQCGFKLFSSECAERVFPQLKLTRFAFDVEALAVASLLKFEIKEVPIVWRNDTLSKVSVFRSPIEMIFELFKLKWNLIRNIYK